MKIPLSLFSIRTLGGLLLLAPLLRAQESAPSPSDLVAAVLAHHPELKFYEAELDAAKAGRRTAGALADPELAVSVGRKKVRDSLGTLAGEGTAWSVSLTQTFEWPGRLALRKSIANRHVELAELGLARFRAALAARTQVLLYGTGVAAERRNPRANHERGAGHVPTCAACLWESSLGGFSAIEPSRSARKVSPTSD